MKYKIRDRRDKGWFYLDNEYLNGYAKIFGAVGTAIYVSLCRHANNETQECFPSMDLIGQELNISRNTVSKYLKLFEEEKLIASEKTRDEKTRKWKNNTYWLLDKSEWESHAQLVSMGSHAQLVSEPCTFDSKSHAQPLGNKETHINYTHIKETNSTFDQFYNSYPKKELKKKTEEIWKRKNPPLKEILGFIEKAKLTDRWKKGYIKSPPAFLNGECWNDDLSAYNDIDKNKPQALKDISKYNKYENNK